MSARVVSLRPIVLERENVQLHELLQRGWTTEIETERVRGRRDPYVGWEAGRGRTEEEKLAASVLRFRLQRKQVRKRAGRRG